jgi:hydrogenase nickel incorporation protein HypA/HybF
MHEQGMARRLAAAAVAEASGHPVGEVVVELTPLSGTSPDALRMAWRAATHGTSLGSARLVVEERPALLRCGGCGATHRPNSPHDVLCPRCGAPVAGVGPADPAIRAFVLREDQGSSDSTSRSRRSSSA